MLKRQEGLPIPQTIFFEDWFTPGLFVMQGGARTLTCTRQVHVRNGPCPTPKGMDSIGHLFTAMWQVSCNYLVLFNDRNSPRNMRFDPKSFELFLIRTATAGSDVVQSGRPIYDDFFQHLWPYIGNNTANVVFQMVKRLWLIRIDQ
ncbi:hypothetical protein TNCV_3760951 [Trichonephila clavipes]|nr:hypothetical protein TNCV_3760951 [Trichonephila clavipes]